MHRVSWSGYSDDWVVILNFIHLLYQGLGESGVGFPLLSLYTSRPGMPLAAEPLTPGRRIQLHCNSVYKPIKTLLGAGQFAPSLTTLDNQMLTKRRVQMLNVERSAMA